MFICLIGFSLSLFAQDHEDIRLANEYLQKGEKEKAVLIFKELAKKQENISAIHNNYLSILISENAFTEANDYLKKNLKRQPQSIQYQLDQGFVWMRSGEVQKADKQFKAVISANSSSTGTTKMISDYFSARALFDYAIASLSRSRADLQNADLFCLELATLYRIKGDKQRMAEEYLRYATQNVGNVQYIKNVLQVLLTKPEELATLEDVLYNRVQEEPEEQLYSDLLIWVMLQRKDFENASLQARAFDKRYKTKGTKSLEVAEMALENKDYDNAAKTFNQVSTNKLNTENYHAAKLGYLKSKEAQVRITFPIIKDSVRVLVGAYKEFIKQHPNQSASLEASRNLSNIQATFLNEQDTAIKNLTSLISNPLTSPQLKSKAKMDLADVYLFINQPWESALLYAQVEKTQKENSIGYEAKLKNAKLSYFRGDFQLAQEHLDILKQATTREIANDALDLSMLIKENIAIDSNGTALKEFAQTELLLTQNKTEEALLKLEKIKQGFATIQTKTKLDSTIAFNNQAIVDDCLWLEAKLRLKKGEADKAILLLQKIMLEYPQDILVDDAFFMIAEIYERYLHDEGKAMEQYKNLLEQFPGSVYSAEARKRYRILRGDFSISEDTKL